MIQVDLHSLKKAKKNEYQSFILETKKRGTDSTSPDEIDINIIDKQQYHELLIPMPSVLKRRSLFETETDPDAIKIELFGDEKLCGSLLLSPEDLRLLVKIKISFLQFH